MEELALSLPESTRRAIERLAEFTGRRGPERLAHLIQDALRTYEWVLMQQAHGRTIVALESDDVRLLEHHEGLDGQRPALDDFLAGDQVTAAREYFHAPGATLAV